MSGAATSSAPAVARALAHLRETGRVLRTRPATAVHAALAEILDAWSAPGSAWQKALVERLPQPTGFSPETVREGLARGLAPYTGSAFHALVRAELGGSEALDAGRAAGFDVTATVLGGAIPMPAVVSMLAPLALRSPVLVKPAAHDPVTAPLLAEALAERDPALGAAVAVVDFRRDDAEALDALCTADCVVATGSDEAVAALAARAGAACPPRHFIGYGHRFSLALLGPQATHGDALTRAAEGLALDVALWDQLGCLSLVSVHVTSADPHAVDRVAEALAAVLARTEARLPRGRVEPEAAAAITRERAEVEMRAAAGRSVVVLASPGTAWTVVRDDRAALRPSPLHRFVRVHPAADAEVALAAVRPRGAQLAAVALAGFGAATAEITAELLALGASRVCAPGELQSPPLAWRRDGLGVFAPLARFGSLELR